MTLTIRDETLRRELCAGPLALSPDSVAQALKNYWKYHAQLHGTPSPHWEAVIENGNACPDLAELRVGKWISLTIDFPGELVINERTSVKVQIADFVPRDSGEEEEEEEERHEEDDDNEVRLYSVLLFFQYFLRVGQVHYPFLLKRRTDLVAALTGLLPPPPENRHKLHTSTHVTDVPFYVRVFRAHARLVRTIVEENLVPYSNVDNMSSPRGFILHGPPGTS